MAQIEVDFNSRDDQGYVPALVADADGPLQLGAWVEAFDLAGFHCLAMVVGIADEVIALDPIWRTFSRPGASRLRLQPIAGRRFEWSGPLSVTLVSRVTHILPITSGAAEPEPA
jgi:hypothetical protein